MNKRDGVLSLLGPGAAPTHTPAAFFMHFGPAYHEGPAAIAKHLEYFRRTGMDFVKIQYERVFPEIAEIKTPADWPKMPVYDASFYAAPLEVVRGLVEAVKGEALVLMTLYSPFMCAGHTTSDAIITAHLKEAPEAVKPGLEAITESLLIFVRACIDIGIEGSMLPRRVGRRTALRALRRGSSIPISSPTIWCCWRRSTRRVPSTFSTSVTTTVATTI